MPLFPVKKQVFVWIATGRKTIEIRKGKAKKGGDTVFQLGRKPLRRKITKTEEGSLTDVLRQDNYKKIIPTAKGLEEAIMYLKGLYGTVEGTFTAYYFDLSEYLKM